MHLIKQLCPDKKQKIDINMSAAQMNDWLAEAQMSNSFIKTSQKTSNFTILKIFFFLIIKNICFFLITNYYLILANNYFN